MRAVLVFCEGSHDIVFATRSLGALAGGKWMGQPISKLPSPFGPRTDPSNPQRPVVRSFIVERLRTRAIDELRLRDAAHPAPPSFQAFVHVDADDVLFALLRSGGDSAAKASLDLIQDVVTLMPLGLDVTEVAVAFLFDADVDGVQAREASFERTHQRLLGSAGGPKHGVWVNTDVNGMEIPVGLYIFHDPSTGEGTLEDTLAPMVASEWPKRWTGAETYLGKHQEAQDPVATKRSERLKAQISISGQFLFPGDPMTQVLARNGLPSSHFQGPASKALVDFLRSAPW